MSFTILFLTATHRLEKYDECFIATELENYLLEDKDSDWLT